MITIEKLIPSIKTYTRTFKEVISKPLAWVSSECIPLWFGLEVCQKWNNLWSTNIKLIFQYEWVVFQITDVAVQANGNNDKTIYFKD